MEQRSFATPDRNTKERPQRKRFLGNDEAIIANSVLARVRLALKIRHDDRKVTNGICHPLRDGTWGLDLVDRSECQVFSRELGRFVLVTVRGHGPTPCRRDRRR